MPELEPHTLVMSTDHSSILGKIRRPVGDLTAVRYQHTDDDVVISDEAANTVTVNYRDFREWIDQDANVGDCFPYLKIHEKEMLISGLMP